MVIFDATSLFTSIPQDLAVETIELLLREKYDETENGPGQAQIIQFLKFCPKTYFTFDGTIYEQVKGTPMGSPISGIIAEVVQKRLQSLVFRHHRPKFWARYVDESFVVIERDKVLTFKEHVNAVFPDIQFTMEEEENNQLAFLGVLVCRKDCDGLKTKVFTKATNTTQILNFNSNHPISYKRSCDSYYRHAMQPNCLPPFPYTTVEGTQAVSNSGSDAEDNSSLASPCRLNQNHSRFDVCTEENAKTTNVPVVGDSKPITDILPGVDQKLRKIRQCPIPQDGFLSPYLASDLLLSRLPPLGIVSCRFDPFLDDCLELAKRVDKLGVPVEFHALDDMPHAFLNFSFMDNDFNRATLLCCEIILRLMRGQVMTRPRAQDTAPDPPQSQPS
nr:unnamed protein product [Spirometra erinaceieuropaei]